MTMYDDAVENAIQKLLNYHRIERELRRWELKLYIKEHEMYDLKAIRYDKDVHGASQLSHDQLINVQSSSRDYIIEQIDRCRVEWEYINNILKSVDDEHQEMVNDKFVACMSWAEMEIKYNYSRKHLKRKIKKAVNSSMIIIQTCPHGHQKSDYTI